MTRTSRWSRVSLFAALVIGGIVLAGVRLGEAAGTPDKAVERTAPADTGKPGREPPGEGNKKPQSGGMMERYRFLVDKYGPFRRFPIADVMVAVNEPFDIRAKNGATVTGALRRTAKRELHFKGRVSQGGMSVVFDSPVELGVGQFGTPEKPPDPAGFDESGICVRFTLSHVEEFVPVGSGVTSKRDELIVLPGSKGDQRPSQWFDSGLKAKHDLTAGKETWLLFRSQQHNSDDRLWVERIDRAGNTFTVTMNRAVWVGPNPVKGTFHQIHGISLGEVPAGKYVARWVIRDSTYTEVGKDRRPKNLKPPTSQEVQTSFQVRRAQEPELKKSAKEQYRILVIQGEEKGSRVQWVWVDQAVTLDTPFDVRAKNDGAAAKGVLQRTKDGGLQFKGDVRMGYHVGTVDAPVELGKAVVPKKHPDTPLAVSGFVRFERPQPEGAEKAVKVIKRASDLSEKVVAGKVGSTGDQLLVVAGPRPAVQKPSQWFQDKLKADNTLTADQETWLLYCSRQFSDYDRMSIERIEQQSNTFTVITNRALYLGPLYRNATYHEVHGINLGKLPAGGYTVEWIIRQSMFTHNKAPTPDGVWGKLKETFTVRAAREREQGK
jgi:hypothetical protein